jgi:hypothetical protein
MMLDLTEEETDALNQELHEIVENRVGVGNLFFRSGAYIFQRPTRRG